MKKQLLISTVAIFAVLEMSASAQSAPPQPPAAAPVSAPAAAPTAAPEATPAAAVITTAEPAAVADPAAVDPAAAKAAAKAREKQLKEWKRQYGEGPYPDETDAFLANKPDGMKPYWRALYTGGERNAVLNFERLGVAAMEQGYWKTAEKAFDEALARIEAVYGSNPQADAARSVFRKEANKDYKGEPYERSMAYYYRGLLYLRKGDFNNARASFKGAEYQDTIAEAEEFKSDFALMNYLIGWSSRCSGDNGDTDFEAAVAAQPGLTIPPAGDNLLLIAELGQAPRKAQDGAQKEKMVFVAADPVPETAVDFIITPEAGAPVTVAAVPASSVYYQATTRGGRAMDGVLKGKASWKTTTGDVGNVAMVSGLSMMSSADSSMAGAGAVVALGGLVFSAFSSAMRADADIRYWETLPDNIVVATTRQSSRFTAKPVYKNDEGAVDLPAVTPMVADAPACKLIWSHARPLNGASETPGDDPKISAAVARSKDAAVKNRAFRDSLADFPTDNAGE